MTLLTEIQDRYDREDLRQNWMALEQLCRPSFFLTWRWIGTWLDTAATTPLLVTCRRDGRIVALGLLQRHQRTCGPARVRQICLHETGDPVLDGPMIEHNGFLVAPEEREAFSAIVRRLQQDLPDWDELVLGGVAPDTVRQAQAAGLTTCVDRENPTFVAKPTGAWLEGRSKGLKAQLRQSRSFAEQAGPVSLVAAQGTAESLAFFEHMIVLHAGYWHGRNKPGAFATEHSRAFHRHLIAAAPAGGKIWLLRLEAGGQVLGYLYNFQAYDRIYAYQSGFAYGSDNRDRPGLLAHALAIKHAAAQGVTAYDFLAGDSPYKARLGDKGETLLWVRAGRPGRPLLTLERTARALKRLVVR
jgi:CelD/BcsL family acetyltransferase involved in cellulose biosynthesis